MGTIPGLSFSLEGGRERREREREREREKRRKKREGE